MREEREKKWNSDVQHPNSLMKKKIKEIRI